MAPGRQPFEDLPAEERTLLRAAPAPTHAHAMKAVLTDERFSDDGWIFERKLDGVRCVAIRDGGPVRLLSRNDLSMNGRYPEVAEALEAQPQSRFAVDGEVVAFDGSQTSFAKLAQRGRKHVPVFFYIFDVLSRCAPASGCCATPCTSRRGRCASPRTATATGRCTSPRHAARAGRASLPSAPTARTPTAARRTG
jgi:ATP-dependent DNA ligase